MLCYLHLDHIDQLDAVIVRLDAPEQATAPFIVVALFTVTLQIPELRVTVTAGPRWRRLWG